ncbi:MAG: hydrogenase 4 subunit F [Alicyclobacillaceae bacterium]|nr:hydrogenase 4 subunit F [Alicyclobacillaceae bacterium]
MNLVDLWVPSVVLLPIVVGLTCVFLPWHRALEVVHLAGVTMTCVLLLWLVSHVVQAGAMTTDHLFFHVDALSAVLLLILALVGWTAGLHSIGYIRREWSEKALNMRQIRAYYALYHGFFATMIFVVVVNNLGLLWVGMEATTVVSAFLVAIYHKAEAIEATWKYLLLCSAGIALALLGVILLYASSIVRLGVRSQGLDWTVLSNPNLHLQPQLVLLSFAFILVGFGTKVGLAPMHFWLPDAHSQAPSPISALLSGALLNCAMFALIRFAVVAEDTLSGHWVQHLLIGFGLLSVFVALPFLLVQRDFKRMLAFSTVEHMGIIAVAMGIGGPLGYSAALFQMFNHSMGKSMLFLGAGNVVQQYRTKQMGRMVGVLRRMPFTGVVLIIGLLTVTGVPPFSVFTSEFTIFVAGFQNRDILPTIVLMALIALVFAAMLYHLLRMVFGEHERVKSAELPLSRWSTWPLLLPMVLVVTMGVYAPQSFSELIQHASDILARIPS